MAKQTIADLQDLNGKRVLVRVDFNVSIKPKEPTRRDEAVIADDTRIRAALPTIQALIAKRAKVILVSHLGRPDGTVKDGLRMDVVAARLSELLGKPVAKADDVIGPDVEAAIAALTPGDVLMLENVRFHPEEEAKDDAVRLPFAQQLAALADVYVNDAFGTAHRDHASTASVARYLRPAVAGFLMAKEIETLGAALDEPARPFVAILGGAKIKDKLKLINNLIGKVDVLLIGGGMAFTFYAAQGFDTGKSLLDTERLPDVANILQKAADSTTTLVLPTDIVIAKETVAGTTTHTVQPDQIPPDWMGLDIGPASVALFRSYVKDAKLVFWNGPMGLFEVPEFAEGTLGIAEAVALCEGYTIIGGGDVVTAVNKTGYAEKMDFISTGGGASIEFMEGKPLPGVVALDEK